MIRIIFENGAISQLDNVERVYIEKKDMDKVLPVNEIAPIEFTDDTIKMAVKAIKEAKDRKGGKR